ncbi:TetR/AcrR family transcriptional regulator [Nocardia jejuensis]|uniref:TetR/AcrR family transcriptional regulator n=1 Tax=Nocardia jejuensis TaxID=328049 RepID=UPI000A031FA7|nr:TetR/AcrR family transcriptional regulator [Nocardia jejuensis]
MEKSGTQGKDSGAQGNSTGAQGNPERPHTGRRRNEATHQAILDAAVKLLAKSAGAPITIDSIARAAGVGKQTVYRWWPSKGAVLLDALLDRSQQEVPTPDTGTLREDLRAVIAGTFLGAQRSPTAPALRTLAREAARDEHLAELMREFVSRRRAAVREILERGRDRGELAADADPDLMVDQIFGVFWYRFLLGHAPLDRQTADRLTDSILGRG